MSKVIYPVELVQELRQRVRDAALHVPFRLRRYEDGDQLELSLRTVWPEREGRAVFRVERFVGGGFAGQVYRCHLVSVSMDDGGTLAGPGVGGTYAVKILIPPTAFSRAFRNLVYWLGFQSPFSAQTNGDACRAGLLWQLLCRKAAAKEFADEESVADVYASFLDTELRAWGEIREWVEGRTWLLEPDITPWLRRRWKTLSPEQTGSPEFVAKKQFMHRFVRMLRRMGARELARQYEWWTMKSQPNVLKRTGRDAGPADGLCAVDFRAGLALLPFLPMSPRDIGLIVEGMLRGSWVQFDRADFGKLRQFIEAEGLAEWGSLVDALERYDRGYRRAMPDVTHQGFRLLVDASLRCDVRRGLTEAHRLRDRVDDAFAEGLPVRPCRFFCFQALGVLPLVGKVLQRLWGHRGYRRHVRCRLTNRAYGARAIRAGVARRLIGWLRTGRAGEERVRTLVERPLRFWCERVAIGWMFACLHRVLAEPGHVWGRMKAGWGFVRAFMKDERFREQWLTDQIEDGRREGVLSEDEYAHIIKRVKDPFIIKYLKCVAFHFATLPITQIFSLTIAAILAGFVWAAHGFAAAAGWFFGILAFFQVIPISPGSLCRGLFTVALVIKERDVRSVAICCSASSAWKSTFRPCGNGGTIFCSW